MTRSVTAPARAWAWATLALLLVAGCATRAPGDGVGANPPPDLHRAPSATPRVEPLRQGGPNKPYTVLGQSYSPLTTDAPLQESGLASWYGRKFHGKPTASGEIYDMYAMTGAHRTMPIPSYARVRNPANGREVIVRINDRGPFAAGRVIDLSYTAALQLGVLAGVAQVQVQRLTFAEIRAGVEPPPAPTAPDDPAPGDAAPTAGFWLQLGAFRQRDSALQLQQHVLREVGAALPGVAVVAEGALHRVQAGPFASREQAQAAAERVRGQLGLVAVLLDRR